MQTPNVSRREDASLLTMRQAMGRYQLSKGLIESVARKCDAKRKIGRCARFDRQKIDRYLGIASETL